jgi:hypothetical protein
MTEVTCERADLTSVVSIVLHQIRDHVHDAARHSFHARFAGDYRNLEETREIFCRPPKRSSSLHRCRTSAIERRRAGPRAAHARKRTPNALHVRDDGCH